MTDAEMQEQGGAPREVNFTLPSGSAAILRQVPGYEFFDERTECLCCIEAGARCKGAPWAFYETRPGHALASVQRRARQVRSRARGRAWRGVGDLAGQKERADKFIGRAQSVFGKIKGDCEDFTNCGVHRRRSDDGAVALD
eukprot:4740323-Pyramimonas_sp.AAC.1